MPYKYCPECGTEFLAETEDAVCSDCDILLALKARVAHLEAIEAAMANLNRCRVNTEKYSLITGNLHYLIRKGMKDNVPE